MHKNQNKTTLHIFSRWNYGLNFEKYLTIPFLISITKDECIIHFTNPASLYQDWIIQPKDAAILSWLEWCFILVAKLEALTGEELLLCRLVFLLLCNWQSIIYHALHSNFFFACFPAHHNIIMFLFLPARGWYFLLLRQQLHCTTLMNPHKGKMCL